MLRFDQLSLRRGHKLLFTDASFSLYAGWKVGVTGGNGSGKSSLFSLILGDLQADAGRLDMPVRWEVAHVAQETQASNRSAIDYVMDGDKELRQIEQQLMAAEATHDGLSQSELHDQLQAIGGYGARARAGQLMHGLGFTSDQEEQPVNQFSGGWRVRLNLAQALMCRSDLLLLDEPTNHLDLDAVIWLEGWLKNYTGTLLLISHDREFLDRVVGHILHIEQQQVQLYSGNYSSFEQTRATQLANQQTVYEKQQREIVHIRRYVERFRAKATKARQAQSRLKALERMELIGPAHVDSPFHFRFFEPAANPHPLLQLDDSSVGYAGQTVLTHADCSLQPGDRIGLIGPNGAGKSTLIKLLAGSLTPISGHRQTAQELKIGYFAQHQIEQLDPQASPLLHLQRLDPKATEQTLRDFLGGFDFVGDRALQPVAPFSGGEKSRLVLALLVYQRPNLLLLDEPTNHLDLEMRHALGQALQEYAGAMVIVSHDRHLLRITTDQLWLVYEGRITEFPGDLEEYPDWLAAQTRISAGSNQQDKRAAHTADSRKQRKRLEAELRKQLQPLKHQQKKLEQALHNYQQQQQQLEALLGQNELYAEERKPELRQHLADKAELDRLVASTEEEWLEVSEKIEAAQTAETV